MKKPIIKFKNDKQLQERLKYWQDKLFLNDWTIKCYLSSEEEFILKGNHGENQMDYVNKCALIRILKDYNPNDYIQIQPDEQVLIHELLHCKFISCEPKEKQIEDCIYDTYEHSLLEQLAKIIFMCEYNLDFEYFKN